MNTSCTCCSLFSDCSAKRDLLKCWGQTHFEKQKAQIMVRLYSAPYLTVTVCTDGVYFTKHPIETPCFSAATF